MPKLTITVIHLAIPIKLLLGNTKVMPIATSKKQIRYLPIMKNIKAWRIEIAMKHWNKRSAGTYLLDESRIWMKLNDKNSYPCFREQIPNILTLLTY